MRCALWPGPAKVLSAGCCHCRRGAAWGEGCSACPPTLWAFGSQGPHCHTGLRCPRARTCSEACDTAWLRVATSLPPARHPHSNPRSVGPRLPHPWGTGPPPPGPPGTHLQRGLRHRLAARGHLPRHLRLHHVLRGTAAHAKRALRNGLLPLLLNSNLGHLSPGQAARHGGAPCPPIACHPRASPGSR